MSSRSSDKTLKIEELFDTYLQSGFNSNVVAKYLKMDAPNYDEKEIDNFVERYKETLHNINKKLKLFISKIESRYNILDTPELVLKVEKFAKKKGLKPYEKKRLLNLLLKGDANNNYLPYEEMAYSKMSEFFGFANAYSFMNIKATDHATLEELAQLYEQSKGLHSAIKSNLNIYRSCALEAVTGKFDKEKHDISTFVHPVLVALFLPRIKSVEKRMLISNFGRLVIQRTHQYVRKYIANNVSVTQKELEADLELMYAIAQHDPNSINAFTDETPLVNIYKRFKIQNELYQNVLALRSGKFYSDSCSNTMVGNLTKSLHSYEWAYFDMPELYHIQDEGNYLKKLMSVFSLRPIFIQYSPAFSTDLGFSNYGMNRFKFVNTPMIPVRLPNSMFGLGVKSSVNLDPQMLNTMEQVVENKMIVVKTRSIIKCSELLVFYANRRYNSSNLSNRDTMTFRYINLPATTSSVTEINNTAINFRTTVSVNNDNFYLRSVVIVNKSNNDEFSTLGCSALIVSKRNTSLPNMPLRNNTIYWYYNPLEANLMFRNSAGKIVTHQPLQMIDEHQTANAPGFAELARHNGSIFIYSDSQDENLN